MKLIVGLGNPGKEYAGDRHNVGFMCLSHFARVHNIPFDRKQASARIGTGIVAGNEVMLARPQTYMNASGESVSRLVKKYHIDSSDLIIIHDDLDLPLGKIRIRPGGSAGGHKGVASIIAALGNPDFIRVRVGIGRPATTESETDVISYVLSDFTPEEKQLLSDIIPRVAEAILSLLTEGLTQAMNKYN
ncbi:MAG: aminoacyl-tRNA hydrolase [Chloroflexi bacterium]|nr:aminoacyl-tRNA hydrolase [Chloroflexota bacterium]